MIKKMYIIPLIFGVFMNSCMKAEIENYSSETYSINSKARCTYTLYRDQQSHDNSTILYYMHGSGGDETTWYKSHREIIKEWRKSGKPSPVVAAITFGERWLLISKNPEKIKSGYMELFLNEIMPVIEKQAGGNISRRYVMGFSMGGANAAQLIFRYPELFEKGVIVSPNIFPISVFSDQKTIDDFVSHENSRIPGLKHWIAKNILGRDRLKATVNMHIARYKNDYIPDAETWEKMDILRNMKKLPYNRTVKIYISCGDKDYNGFYPGAEQLALKASSLSYSTIWKPFAGGHVIKNEEEIAAFLID